MQPAGTPANTAINKYVNHPIQAAPLSRFKGESWELFGDIMGGGEHLRACCPVPPPSYGGGARRAGGGEPQSKRLAISDHRLGMVVSVAFPLPASPV